MTDVVTCGGAQSAHAAAIGEESVLTTSRWPPVSALWDVLPSLVPWRSETGTVQGEDIVDVPLSLFPAAICAEQGIRSHLNLRGEPPAVPTGNNLIVRTLPMHRGNNLMSLQPEPVRRDSGDADSRSRRFCGTRAYLHPAVQHVRDDSHLDRSRCVERLVGEKSDLQLSTRNLESPPRHLTAIAIVAAQIRMQTGMACSPRLWTVSWRAWAPRRLAPVPPGAGRSRPRHGSQWCQRGQPLPTLFSVRPPCGQANFSQQPAKQLSAEHAPPRHLSRHHQAGPRPLGRALAADARHADHPRDRLGCDSIRCACVRLPELKCSGHLRTPAAAPPEGTGATAAGVALGCALLGCVFSSLEAVCKRSPTLLPLGQALALLLSKQSPRRSPLSRLPWRVVGVMLADDAQYYAKTSAALMQSLSLKSGAHRIAVDPPTAQTAAETRPSLLHIPRAGRPAGAPEPVLDRARAAQALRQSVRRCDCAPQTGNCDDTV